MSDNACQGCDRQLNDAFHPNGWSEDLAWNQPHTIDPLWKHWFSLIASMDWGCSSSWTTSSFSGTINELRSTHE